MRKVNLLFIVSILFSVMTLSSCSDGNKSSESTPEASEKAALSEAVRENKMMSDNTGRRLPSSGDSDYYVTITPNTATVDTELAAIAGGNPSDIEFEWKVNGNSIEGEFSNRLSTVHFSRGDRVEVFMYSNKGTVSESTEIVNSPPRIKSIDFAEPRLHKGIDIELIPEYEDADGDSVDIRYVWVLNNQEIIEQQTNILPGTLIQRGDIVSFTAIPNDGSEDGPAYKANAFEIPNGAPRFVSNYPLSFNNFEYSYMATAEDPDDDELYYALEDSPEGMSIDSTTGEIFWQIRPDQDGDQTVRITAEDSEGLRASQEFTLTVNIR